MRDLDQFATDVLTGLKQPVKRLPSKYFYDETGDKIFQEIMGLEEYYLPRCELEILQEQTSDLAAFLPAGPLDIVELGAGDGTKTVHFLENLGALGRSLTYYPLDISPEVLQTNRSHLKNVAPDIPVHPVAGDYFKTLPTLQTTHHWVLLFLGSNIGNYPNEKAVELLQFLSQHMSTDDVLLVGVDLRKHPKTILDAYNDAKGVTRRFNLNLLTRINRELGANFQVEHFDHFPVYDPVTGIAASYLVCRQAQKVSLLGETFLFKTNELIHTEVSQKYSLSEIEQMAQSGGFRDVHHFTDHRDYFSVSVLLK
ncbi:MAG: L-histidine N(alpha)-methyltransferase [Saprospiraceae bacterium]|nr:L-histidine N(alpha)-methyltransferase [Saprospiraceae bacterium]